MKLSIIVCIYNTPREYLRASLESIVNSTLDKYKGEYEIIIVDDGSSIDYSDLISEFDARYTKTENRGILKARLLGIEISSGEYIAFCDSDDTVSTLYYSPMLDEAYKSSADIIINDWAYHAGNKKYYCKNDITIKNDVDVTGNEVLKLFFSGEGKHHSLFVLWNKIYHAPLLRNAAEKIKASGKTDSSYGEDVLINFLAWKMAKKVKNIHRGYYFYRIHESQAVKAGKPSKLKAQIKSMAEALDFMENELSKHPQENELVLSLDEWRSLNARYHYTLAKEHGYTALYDFISESYGIRILEDAKKEDSLAYFDKCYLGDNFEAIDGAILKLWQGEKAVGVRYRKRNHYVDESVKYLKAHGKIEDKARPRLSIPKRKVSLKNKLRFNSTVYKISLVLFKKNSRLRARIKNKI